MRASQPRENAGEGRSLLRSTALEIRAQPDATVDGVADRLRSQRSVDEEAGGRALGDAEAEAAAIFEPALVSTTRWT
jgi:hypothetical protein